ncbi:MAG: PLP-dependent transferase [Parcubacteria group bacterium]|nr:PLP-dependent transferase [Parcubacteria group bacterium]
MARKLADAYGSVVPPLHLSVVHAHDSLESARMAFAKLGQGYAYSRMGNPTVTEFEHFLAEIEGAHPGNVWATNSGLSALTLLVFGLTAKSAGGKRRIVTSSYIYGGAHHQLSLWLHEHGFDVVFLNNPFSLEAWDSAFACCPTAFALLETPCNPTIDVFDIKAIAEVAHKYGVPLVVDNTLGVALQRPLELGADVVLHSTTKAINRHSTGLGGALVASQGFVDRFEDLLNDFDVSNGLIVHPMSAWTSLQGRVTLERDMLDFSRIALGVANFLNSHPKIREVYYPHLPSSRSYDVAMRQMPRGAGGLLSFRVKSFEAAQRLVELLKVPYLGPHLGHSESLVIHPASTTHGKLTPEELAAVNIAPEMVRYSVGLGVPEKVIGEITGDFAQALDQI